MMMDGGHLENSFASEFERDHLSDHRQSLYHKHHTFNTRAADVFSEELGMGEKKNPVKFAEKTSEEPLNLYRGDEVLVNALESVFDQSAPLKLYSGKTAEKGLASVERIL